ncbi:MAG TPA: hypothetical protein PK129_07205 [Cellvibrionaceae bacterium]|nr:hypothetical protein [Cellvibrionaceae bacterium]
MSDCLLDDTAEIGLLERSAVGAALVAAHLFGFADQEFPQP